jgi:DNA-binding transcriptional LysR family regulator
VSVEVDQRWTVSHIASSIQAVRMGHGFAWLPREHIRDELASGLLKPLPLREGRERIVPLYLVLADPDCAGPGMRRLAEIIRETVAGACKARQAKPA